MNVRNHKNIKYCTADVIGTEVNKTTFHHFSEVGEDLYEVQHNKQRIVHKMPVHIGFFILNYAKLRMLSFYYDFLDKYVGRESFSLLQMDTDSMYMSMSGNTIQEMIKPGTPRIQFNRDVVENCQNIEPYVPTLRNPRPCLPRICCEFHIRYSGMIVMHTKR